MKSIAHRWFRYCVGYILFLNLLLKPMPYFFVHEPKVHSVLFSPSCVPTPQHSLTIDRGAYDTTGVKKPGAPPPPPK
ncbi:uncharacterized protein BDW43DRAFT_275503 [Aspergillus alliaceus]|uniref:uncharacterized protein n=1 Tax=Petromyces alliaceus TaxID=209559 RepID=UPI0012A418AB|nr:uncharacterized protein BDW43DRAFT_275503 [Aspergillus alliaceus]KAB8233565.1 hypothetical protein BDW43DRAFT_275503 [Aspergillus alliaceus]